MGDTTDTEDKLKALRIISAGESGKDFNTGIALAPPAYQPSAEPTTTAQMKPDDTVSGTFGDSDKQVDLDSGIRANDPLFDKETMLDSIKGAEFQGAGDTELRDAMIVLQGSRNEEGELILPTGEKLDSALETVAEIRGMDIETAKNDYTRAMEIKIAGEEFGAENEKEDVSPLLDTEVHPDFMGSTSQLRFGMIMGDVFDVDPVFGALISPTGGAVGPGNDSVSTADKNNSVAMHGTVHDAAGYLKNAHNVGPGYNYLKDPYEFFDSDNPLSGQVSGTKYFAEGSQLTRLKDLGEVAGHGAWDYGSRKISDGWDSVKGLASDAWEGTKSGVSDVWNGAKGLASDAWEGTKSGVSDLWNGAKGLASDAWEGTKGAASNAWEGAKGLAGDAWEGTKGVANDAWEGAGNLWGDAKQTAGSAWNGVKSGTNDLWQGSKGLAQDAWSDVKSGVGGIWGGAKSKGKQAKNKAMGLAGDAWGGAKKIGNKTKKRAGKAINSAKSAAKSGWKKFKSLW